MTFQVAADVYERIENIPPGPTSELPPNTDFYAGAYSAKVQLPYQSVPGKTPRKIEVERYAVCPQQQKGVGGIHLTLFSGSCVLFLLVWFDLRRRREYMKLDIEQLLSEKGIDSKHFMSIHQTRVSEDHVKNPNQPGPPASNALPLEVGLILLKYLILHPSI